MKEQLEPAIEALKKELADQEIKVIETKSMINKLSVMAGLPEPYSVADKIDQPSVTSIKSDTFYGKSVLTAAREYLDMRKAANLGPTSIREIFEALKKGGFQFQSKSEGNSMIVVRNALSKASAIFHRLPNGDYGLTKWYDMAKVKKVKSNGHGLDTEKTDPQEEEESVLD